MLNRQIYGDLAQREFVDIALFVAEQDVSAAMDELETYAVSNGSTTFPDLMMA